MLREREGVGDYACLLLPFSRGMKTVPGRCTDQRTRVIKSLRGHRLPRSGYRANGASRARPKAVSSGREIRTLNKYAKQYGGRNITRFKANGTVYEFVFPPVRINRQTVSNSRVPETRFRKFRKSRRGASRLHPIIKFVPYRNGSGVTALSTTTVTYVKYCYYRSRSSHFRRSE